MSNIQATEGKILIPEKEIPMPETPVDLSQYRENPDEMNFISLSEYILYRLSLDYKS